MAANPLYRDRALLCAVCGAAFVSAHPRSKYCSPRCARGAELAKRVAKHAANPAHFRAMARDGYARNKDARIATVHAYARTERGKELQRQRSARRRVTEKTKVDARNELNKMVSNGTIIRGSCRDCGAPNTHGHHHDYSQPLNVIWLCPAHHIAEHRRIDGGL